jgi:glucosamine--fructose-6-phosphate aminotransferase (isomerizing)
MPAVLARQRDEAGPLYGAFGRRLNTSGCRLVMTCARGSSATAATYARYLFGLTVGVPVAALGPSLASVYGARLSVPGALALTISQSGGSPDLAALQQALKAGGALTAALVNVVGSPVADGSAVVLPVCAGPERAVAAQKSLVASMAALAAIAAAWSGDETLDAGLAALPDAVQAGLSTRWDALPGILEGARSVMVIGRGPALAAAEEMALKLKELLGVHAEAFSSAEVMHGPVVLGGPDRAVIALATPDAGCASTRDAARALAARGGRVAVLGTELPLAEAPHPWLAPLTALASFYAALEPLARQRGHDPDAPDGLQKVTRTR